MKIGWVGVHEEGLSAFEAVCAAGYDVTGLITLTSDRARKRCGSVDYSSACHRFDVPLVRVENINDASGLAALSSFACDLIVVLGWGQILGSSALRHATLGTVGSHASLLPHNRGSAPVNWAIIRGETEGGNSLMWLAEGVDSGHLIDQRRFPITAYDTCETVYQKVSETNRQMLLDLLRQLDEGQRPGVAQVHTDEPLLPRRRPKDGQVNWQSGSPDVYNFVRALARPFPGASTFLCGEEIRIWKAAHIGLRPAEHTSPGTVLGPVHCPDEAACGQMVMCADGSVLLLEVEDSAGHVIKGRELSERNWQGEILGNVK